MTLNISNFVHFIEHLLPISVVLNYRFKKASILYYMRYRRALRRIRNKRDAINVIFFVSGYQSWKFASLYDALEKDERFNPLILVCPIINKGKANMVERMQTNYEHFKKLGKNVQCAYNIYTNNYLDAHTLHPDIICYSDPYKGLIDDRYYIDQFKNTLTCYTDYGYQNIKFSWGCSLPLHNNVWKYFLEHQLILDDVKKFSPHKGLNCVVTGYPMYDEFTAHKSIGYDWKIQDQSLKRIIWAPHHTIEGNTELLSLSTFLIYYDIMLQIADEFSNSVQFVFKPHPLLKVALYNHPDWGKKRTDSYYQQWENGKNTSFVDGEYIDLFLSSDAMIHDCGSFTIEYLYTNKPVMYLSNNDRISQSNQIGIEAFNCHYKGYNKEDIVNFIKNVVIEGHDTMTNLRKNFYNNFLLPPNGKTAAENMLNEIVKILENKQ